MITNTIILLLLLAAAVMPVRLQNSLTQDELAEMGVSLDGSMTEENG